MVLLILVLWVSLGFCLKLEEAKRLALENHIDAVKGKIDLKILEERIREVKGSIFPKLRFSFRYTRWDPNYISAFVPENKYNASFSLRQTIFDRSLFKALEVARESRDLQEEILKEIKNTLSAEVEKIYWGVVFRKEVLKEKKETLKYWEEFLRLAELNYKEGISPRHEFLRAKAQYLRAVAEVKRAQSQYVESLSKLKAFLGKEDISEPEEPLTLPKGTNPQSGIFLKEKVLEKSLRVKLKEIALEESKRYPKVSFFFNYNFENIMDFRNGRLQEDTRHGYNLGIEIGWDIYDGSVSPKVAQKKLEANKIRKEISFVRKNLRETLKALRETLEALETEIRALEETLEASREYVHYTTRRYRLGVGSITDVLEARRSFEEARISYLKAILDYRLTLAEIKKLLYY